MAAPQNTYKTHGMTGIREDLSDTIYDISPTETPLVSAIDRVRAQNTYHEWQTDSLDAPVDDNAHVEGDDTVALAASPTNRLGNYTQIFKKAVTVSDTQSSVNKAGRGDEMAYQSLKRTRELKRDIEKSVFANKARNAGSANTPRIMAGLGAWVTTNTANVGGGGSDPVGDGTDARDDGSETALTQADFNTVMKDIWEEGGNPTMVFLSANQMEVATNFTGMNNQRSTIEASRSGDQTVVDALDVYVTNYGTVRFQPSRHCRDQDVWILDMSKWAIATLRPVRNKKLGDTGDNSKRQMVTELTFVSRNEAASGLVADCS